jgi:pimeloyl-ACP methyl ester carboxylesterase
MNIILADGSSLYYQESGQGDALLLIHGTQPDSDVWRGCVDTLSQQYHVIAYDRRGFSRSPHAPEKDYKQHARDAAELIKQLELGRTIVLGWSWGGIVALELAAAYPELVKQLILVEPVLHLKKHITFSLFRAVFSVQLLRRLKGKTAAAEHFLRWAHRYTTGGTAYDKFPAAYHEIVRRNADAICTEIDAGTGEGLTPDRIATIKCPVDFIQGQLSNSEFADAVARLKIIFPNAPFHMINGASHALHYTHSQVFVQTVLAATQPESLASRIASDA